MSSWEKSALAIAIIAHILIFLSFVGNLFIIPYLVHDHIFLAAGFCAALYGLAALAERSEFVYSRGKLIYACHFVAGWVGLALLVAIGEDPSGTSNVDNFFLFFIFLVISGLGKIPLLVGATFIPAMALWVFITSVPGVFVAIVELTSTHPATTPVERAVRQKRPDNEIQQELSAIMERQNASDQDVAKLISERSPVRQWFAARRHNLRAKEARRLRQLAEAKRQAFEEETNLAQSVHALERARRRNADRR